ncbi:NCS2 family permease [Aggregicoccus sp. 17bor-14]|uniref:NCS2 family permease n=1 Tax=Myxococcaceae TaxID=31 RepID=UPI00129CBD68|nr:MULTISPECIES: NCS2 family permease [Myxococcaceae]MBF5044803.1 NCS2 family permease [Simulacricoccus sp. 17bor-14]MRI90547.1 NCS2 family permease [Aggregicoccus sp. 17bor-14]
MNALDRHFRITERGSSVPTELRAGLVTFLTMAYILFVNPQILGQAGMPPADVTVATALGAAFGTLLMGLYANFPFALAPGMGLNAYFTYGVVLGMGVSWRTALTAVFVEGLLFIVLAYAGIRTALIRAIPLPIKLATTAGIGLFLAIIGLKNAGLVVASPATLVQLGDLHKPGALLALGGLVLIAALTSRKVKGSLLIGIAAVTLASWALGLAHPPSQLFSLPKLPRETLWAFDFGSLMTGKLVGVVIAFLFVDIFDTAGTLIGVGRAAGFLDKNGELPGATPAFAADAVGTTVGAVLGTSTVTAYVESAAGVEEGGRTGLTAVTVAVLFLFALFFIPLFSAIPAVATAPALIVVGAMMMGAIGELSWSRLDEGIPAFLTVALMPFTYSIANGIAAGIVSYSAIKLVSGRGREVHPIAYVLSVLLVLHYAFGVGGA